MNVFEDLVIELKEENLLESTVIEPGNAFDETIVPEAEPFQDLVPEEESDVEDVSAEQLEASLHETIVPDAASAAPTKKAAGQEFFKKKAIGEVSSLQMVEHVITGVEREYMKVVPKAFDDFNAKKALNAFLNSEDAAESEEHATAEFNLMHETEAWCTGLALRDAEVPVSALRQYCERARPALSSQAMLALGRFYRNLPYSEPVRSKFDFVITRLFSRPVGQEKRVCLFTRDEMLGHINTLYSDWSSIPLYAVDEDDSNVMLTALSFEDLAVEAENASSFDQLIESDFFGRLRMFKESISELFYAPQVTAAAIDSNIRIGNRYVELIDRERQKLDAESVQLKYADHEVEVSDITGKTLQLADILKGLGPVAPVKEPEQQVSAPPTPAVREVEQPRSKKREAAAAAAEAEPEAKVPFIQRLKANARNVSKWYLIFAVVAITASVILYVWSGYSVEESASTAGVSVVNIESAGLKEYVKTARLSGENFYAQMQPSWDMLPKDKRQDLLQKLFQTAQERGAKQVTLFSAGGKTVGYASAARVDVQMP